MKDFVKMFLAAFFAICAVLGMVVFIVVGGMGALIHNIQGTTNHSQSEKSLLHINLYGEVVDHLGAIDWRSFVSRNGRHQVGLYEISEALKKAATDEHIVGLTVYLSNLDSGWANAQTLQRILLEFRKSKKPIYVYSEGLNELEYLVASAGTQIYMQPNSSIELNGLSISSLFFKDLLDKVGVEPRVFRVGKFKAAIEPFVQNQMSNENRAQNLQLITDIWSAFDSQVKLARTKLKSEQLEAAVNQASWQSSEDLVEPGLIDGVMYMDQVDALVQKETGIDPNGDDVISIRSYLEGKPRFEIMKKSGVKVAVLFAEGTIVGGGGDDGDLSLNSFLSTMQDVEKDEDVKALVLRVNSPGGDASAADAMWRQVTRLSEKMPVVVSMGDYAASGGYYMSAGAQYIFAEPTTITGSIGVFGLMFGTQNLQEKVYLHMDSVKTHALSDIGATQRPMTDTEKAIVQKSVDQVYDRFLTVVEKGRKLDRAQVNEIAQGRVWTGVRAKELKLVDELGGLDSAIGKAAELAKISKYEVEIFPSNSGEWQQVMQLVGDDTEMKLKAFIRQMYIAVSQTNRVQIQARLPYLFSIK